MYYNADIILQCNFMQPGKCFTYFDQLRLGVGYPVTTSQVSSTPSPRLTTIGSAGNVMRMCGLIPIFRFKTPLTKPCILLISHT